ncbi:MAG: hypothetical protein LDL44_20120 [Caenispirillum sp.]|nr:hypothetical protein [Caenispirillum sp.]
MSTTQYAKTLTADLWRGTACDESVIEKPDEADLRRAIDDLDQATHTLVIVAGEGEAHLGVGGGRGEFVVYATFDNRTFYNLIDRSKAGAPVTVVAGGQAGDYPTSQVVDRDRAVVAATRFLTEGRLGDDLGWEVQG